MRIVRGVVAAVRDRAGIFLSAALGVLVLSVLLPPLVLSLARRPVDYWTFNPWLKLLPGYLWSSEVPWGQKLEKLPALALFWFSADSPFGGVDWGFAVDVTDVARILAMAGLFGAYFALWAHRGGGGRPGPAPRRGGVAGALVSALGLSTSPCGVMGCGAPVIPVVGLAFAGLSSGTLGLLAGLSRVTTWLVLIALVVGVGRLGWIAGGRAGAGAAPAPRG